MKEIVTKEFEFYGLDFNLAFAGAIVFLIFVVSLTVGLMFALENIFQMRDSNLIKGRLAFSFVLAVFIGLLFSRFYGRYVKKLWKVVIADKKVEIYFGNKLKNEFLLSDLRKIHINGWFKENNQSSYRWLRLTTAEKNILLILGNTKLINTSTNLEIKSFDDFLSILETFAAKEKYSKIDLKKDYHYSFGRNYYYQKN